MTARTRYFVIGSLLATTAGVSAGLVAYYTGFQAAGSATGPAELRLIPADATLVAFADVRAVMASEIRQEFRRVLPARERAHEEFEQQTGINIERDIEHVVAYFSPAETAAEQPPASALVLARGRFDPARIEAAMRQHGAVVEEYRGSQVFATPEGQGDPSPGNAAVALAFVEPELVAVGSPRLVHATLDLREGGTNVTASGEIADLIQSVNGDVWAVGFLDALTERAQLPPEVADRLPPVRQFTASGRLNGGFEGTVEAEALDESSAGQWRDVARGMIALARLQAAQTPELQGLLDSVQLGGTGRTISLSFTIPPGIVEWLNRTRSTTPPAQLQ
jgi:hypothetical protein